MMEERTTTELIGFITMSIVCCLHPAFWFAVAWVWRGRLEKLK